MAADVCESLNESACDIFSVTGHQTNFSLSPVFGETIMNLSGLNQLPLGSGQNCVFQEIQIDSHGIVLHMKQRGALFLSDRLFFCQHLIYVLSILNWGNLSEINFS